MRKFKILPSILMLVLCVGILAVGIYAVSPAQNNVTGTISVIASNVEVEITAFLGANKATQVSDTITARTSTPVPIKDGKLEFDGSSASSSDAVEDITLVLEIKNNSPSKALGSFFLKDASLPETLTPANITKTINFDGKTTDNAKTESNLVTASLPGYTVIAAGATVDLVCTLSLNQLTDYDMNVTLNLPLVIHDYDSDMQATSISLVTEEGSSVDGVSATITTSGVGAYYNGDTVTLIAESIVDDGYECTYTWYAKNADSTWTQVGMGKTYTFTMSKTSSTEFMLVYSVIEAGPRMITLSYEGTYNYHTISGMGEYEIGDTVNLTVSHSKNGTMRVVIWKTFDSNGEYSTIFTESNVQTSTYSFTLTSDSPTDYYFDYIM